MIPEHRTYHARRVTEAAHLPEPPRLVWQCKLCTYWHLDPASLYLRAIVMHLWACHDKAAAPEM